MRCRRCASTARATTPSALMRGERREAEGEAGWLAGLPVAIKDLTDVAGVRTTYGSPIFADHVPTKSHPLVERIERKGGIVIAKSNTPEFGAGGSTFNEVFGRTRNPWNTSLTCGGSTGGGAVALATGEVWLAHGSDHGGSLRRPGDLLLGGGPAALARPRDARHPTICGRRCRCRGRWRATSPTWRCSSTPWRAWARTTRMTFDAPARSFSAAVASRCAPKRVAFTADFGGTVPMDREMREICAKAARRFEELGASSRRRRPISARSTRPSWCCAASISWSIASCRSQQHRDKLKPDIIWNTERGLDADARASSPGRSASARRSTGAWSRFFETYDVLVTPGASTPPST